MTDASAPSSAPSAPSATAPLVSTAWLAARLAADPAGVRVLDVRGAVLPPGAPPPRYVAKREAYLAGHLPGAAFVDWTKDIVDPDDAVPYQVARPEAFAALMASLGIGEGTLVVVYDDYSHMFAGRLYWALRYFGHDAACILEGGFTRWVEEGRPLDVAIPSYADARPEPAFTARPREALVRSSEQVAATLEAGARPLLVDARSQAQYEGKASAASRAGHIPGALNVPYPSLLEGPGGAFLPAEKLREVFAKAGVPAGDPSREIIVYCNGGVSATVPMVALESLGFTRVALYDGSWSEWGNDPSRPIETGGG